MAEVPEHLLQRSRERRKALGLAGGDDAGASPGGESAPAPVPASSPATGAGAGGGAAMEPARPAAAAVSIPEEPPVSPVLVAGQAAARTRVPTWVVPVLVVLPFWGFLYLGAFGDRETKGPVDPMVLGAQVYRAQGCSACHGGAGEGGVGPPLAGGESVLTFPNEADHEAWVKNGSGGSRGQPYGDPNRPGGQRGPATGGMPGFPSLSDAELKAVVQYEREGL